MKGRGFRIKGRKEKAHSLIVPLRREQSWAKGEERYRGGEQAFISYRNSHSGNALRRKSNELERGEPFCKGGVNCGEGEVWGKRIFTFVVGCVEPC